MKPIATFFMSLLVVLSIFSITVCIGSMPACSPTFLRDAVQKVNTFTATVLNWLALATQTFQAIAPLLGESQRTAAQAEFDRGVLATRAALAALQDASDVAGGIEQGAVNRAQLVQAVLDAVKNVGRIVALYQQPATAAGDAPKVGAARDNGLALARLQLSVERHGAELMR